MTTLSPSPAGSRPTGHTPTASATPNTASPASRHWGRRFGWGDVSTAAACLVAAVATVLAVVLPWSWPRDPGRDVVDGFPLARAQSDLATISAAAHPLGSPANAAVRDFLIGELRAMGLDPQVQSERVTLRPETDDAVWTAQVNNVVARLTGTGADHTAALMLAAHYDSVPTGPGAGDNGAGVAAVLETMRVLAAGPAPRHDVIVLFTDGEEHEMLGSRAFVDSHSWIRDVRVVLNTEGVGAGGRVTPALTTADNGWVMRRYLHAAPAPVVYSAFDAPLNALNMGADLGRYSEVVPAGLEFVVLDKLSAYHSSIDTAANAEPGTLAEFGTTLLALSRDVANADLSEVTAPDLVAFTLTRHTTVGYSSRWSLPLALLAFLAVIGALVLAARRGRIKGWSVVRSLVGLGAGVLLALAAATALTWLARLTDPRIGDAVQGGTYHRLPWLLAAATLTAAALALSGWWLRRRHTALDMIAGGLVGWALLAVLLAIAAPTAAYLPTWPLLAATAGYAVLVARPRLRRTTLVVGTLAALPALVLTAPLVYLYWQLVARLELISPLVFIGLPVLLAAFGLTLSAVLLAAGVRRLTWRPAAALALAGVVLLTAGVVIDRADTTNPRPDLLVYRYDADTGTAQWIAAPVDDYTGQVATSWRDTTLAVMPFHEPDSTVAASAATAPAVRLPGPAATVTADTTNGGTRTVTFSLTAPAGTYAVTVEVSAPQGIRALTVNGTPGPTGSPARIVDFSPGPAGLPLGVTVDANQPVQLRVVGYTLGLPPQAATVQPRSARHSVAAREIPDSTLVTTVIIGVADETTPGGIMTNVSLADEIALLAYDEDGSTHGMAAHLDVGLAGALLLELALARRIDVAHGHVVVVDQTPTGDALSDAALGRIAGDRKSAAAIAGSVTTTGR